MIEEREVELLPKDVSEEKTASNGALKRYQEKIIEQFLTVLNTFQKSTKDVAKSCENQLQARMAKFNADSGQIKSGQENILQTLGTTNFTFDELRDQLKEKGQSLIELSLQLREDIVALYSGSFALLKPIVDNAYASCELYLSQLPVQYSEKLPHEVNRLNENFLQTKHQLIASLYNIEMKCREHASNTDAQFLQRADEWKQNRFLTIANNAKKQLDPLNPLDLDNIYKNFHEDQSKFTHCFQKLLNNLTLIIPPDHFTETDLETWWKEVSEILESHKNFISQFISKIQAEVDKRNQDNSLLISTLEKDLFELVSENDANMMMGELTPLYKQSQKYNSSLIEKLQKYWGSRSESLFKSFEAIRMFLKPLIENYQKFIQETDENYQFVTKETEEIKNSSNATINQLETDLEQKSNEIMVLVSEKNIANCVSDCKQILTKMEKEFKESYTKIITTYDTQPSLVMNLYEKIEGEMLSIVKMKKTANSSEFENSSNFTGANSKGKAANMSQLRSVRRPIKPKLESKNTNTSSFSFSTNNGAKFEELCQISLVPQFDDFVDEPTTPVSTPHKGRKVNGKTTTPNRGGRRGAKVPQRGGRGSNLGGRGGNKNDDSDDIEAPEFNLSDIVPKVEGVISIWVYIPMNEELNEWTNTFRKTLISSFSDEFTNRVIRANYTRERDALSEELNERMRVHAPRAHNIELNVAQKRVNQIESRQAQLEKHFMRTVANFNKGIKNVQASLEKRKAALTAECNKLRTFIDNLSKQKATSSFAVLKQNYNISNKQFEKYFEKQTEEQKTEISNFVNNFNSINERFMNSVVMGDGSFSKEEKDRSNEYFEKMKASVNDVIKDLDAKAADVTDNVEKLHKSITDEFEQTIIHHKQDVAFVETLKQAQTDAKMKYETLLTRNKLMESDLDRIIGLTDINNELDTQSRMVDLFKKLDEMRITVIKRGIFLSLLKSNIEPEPFEFTVDLLRETTASPTKSRGKGGDVQASSRVTDNSRHSRNEKSKGKSGGRQSKNERNDKSGKVTTAPDTALGSTINTQRDASKNMTLKMQFEQFGNDYMNIIMKLATDYYNNVKTRKFGITRTELIPQQQSDCIEENAAVWKKTTTDFISVVKDSNLHFRTQVQTSANIAREMQKKFFHDFPQFYIEQVAKDRSDAQIHFEEQMRDLTKQRNANKNRMSPEIADQNKMDDFKKLLEVENERTNKENDCISSFYSQIIDIESKEMNLFSNNLSKVTQRLLNMFDKFLQLEDLSTGETVEIERKTMRELLKEKGRKSVANNNDPNGRPFHTRDWPTLNVQMEPLIQQQQQLMQMQQMQQQMQQQQQGDGRKVDSRVSNRSSTINAERNLSKKKKPTKSGLLQSIDESAPQVAQTAVVNSLDTALNRGAIVERNNGYKEYETALAKRLSDFNAYIQSLKEETCSFTKYWQKCAAALNPSLVRMPEQGD